MCMHTYSQKHTKSHMDHLDSRYTKTRAPGKTESLAFHLHSTDVQMLLYVWFKER